MGPPLPQTAIVLFASNLHDLNRILVDLSRSCLGSHQLQVLGRSAKSLQLGSRNFGIRWLSRRAHLQRRRPIRHEDGLILVQANPTATTTAATATVISSFRPRPWRLSFSYGGIVVCQLVMAVYQYVICDVSSGPPQVTWPSANRKSAMPRWENGGYVGVPVSSPVVSRDLIAWIDIPQAAVPTICRSTLRTRQGFFIARESTA